ncbi:MAG: glutathione S-transferase N-terminal domain-containing protein [Halobacteria archaeon]
MALKLYELKGCPFCMKVKEKLDDLGLKYDSVEVPANKSKRHQVEAVSGQKGVPVLVDTKNDVEGMPESDDIIEYLEETYG